MSYVVVVVVVRTCKCINTICSIFFFLEMLVQGVQGKTFCWESIYGIWSDSKKKNRLTESSQLSKRSSMEMHCKVCSPIWNTKNLIYKKKFKKLQTFHSFSTDFSYLPQNFASLFTDISLALLWREENARFGHVFKCTSFIQLYLWRWIELQRKLQSRTKKLFVFAEN